MTDTTAKIRSYLEEFKKGDSQNGEIEGRCVSSGLLATADRMEIDPFQTQRLQVSAISQLPNALLYIEV